MDRRVLITGAGGFVGAALARGFARLGWNVTAVDRRFDDGFSETDVRRITVDLGGSKPLDLPGSDLVIHGAWITSPPDALGIHPSEYPALNLGPLMAMMAHVQRSNPAAFVFLSSSGVFSPEDGTDWLTDDLVATGTSLYGAMKRGAEELILSPARERRRPGPTPPPAQTRFHVVRLGYLYGPHEGSRPSRTTVSLVARWVEAARGGGPLEIRADDPRRDWTFVEDLAPALERLVGDAPTHRPAHLCSPYVLRDSELASLVASRSQGVGTVVVPAGSRAKPPMAASELPALEGFDWTTPEAGLDALFATQAAAS